MKIFKENRQRNPAPKKKVRFIHVRWGFKQGLKKSENGVYVLQKRLGNGGMGPDEEEKNFPREKKKFVRIVGKKSFLHRTEVGKGKGC